MEGRLATIIKLEAGGHEPDSKYCLMEAVAFVNGDPWTDHPECACPVLSAYGRALNDAMPDEQRQRLIPYIPLLIGTRSNLEVEQQRAFILADLAVRVIAPIALRCCHLVDESTVLETLPPIMDVTSAESAESAAKSAAKSAWSAESARYAEYARYAAWSAESAAKSAKSARSAAEYARYAAWSARYAAWSAESAKYAGYAAWSAESAKYAGYAAESAAEYAESAAEAWDKALEGLDKALTTKEEDSRSSLHPIG